MTRKSSPAMHATQAAYAVAKVAYDAASEAHAAKVRAGGWWDRDDEESLDLIEASAERHGTSALWQALHAAEKAMVTWSLENIRPFATRAGKAADLPTVDELERHPREWSQAVDLAFRAAIVA